jgi:hypothetical protein
MAETLNSTLYVPDKCPEPQLLGLLVHVVKDLQQGLYPLVLYHCKNGGAHGRPGVTAVMRLTGLGTASANLLPISEAPAIEPVECSNDTLVICLIECD